MENKRKLIFNLCFLHEKNGMYYFFLDYLKVLKDFFEIEILFNKNNYHIFTELHQYKNKITSPFNMILKKDLNLSPYDILFAPTPHPIPFVSNQIITLHDNAPFIGLLGWLKLFLLQVSLKLSDTTVGFINEGEAKLIAKGLSKKIFFTPNYFELTSAVGSNESQTNLVLGLAGTSSKKKNYQKLFNILKKYGLEKKFEIHIYGLNNKYFRKISDLFPQFRMKLINSSDFTLNQYIESISCIVSINKYEGFSRPIAQAILSGRGAFLLDTPVFREFYGGSADFFSKPEELISFLNSDKLESSVRKINNMKNKMNYLKKERNIFLDFLKNLGK